MNFVSVDKLDGQVPAGVTEIGVRPEHLHLANGNGSAEGPTMRGQVVTVERLGAEAFVYLDTGQPEPLVAKVLGDVRASPGETMAVGAHSAALYLFDADGRCHARETYH